VKRRASFQGSTEPAEPAYHLGASGLTHGIFFFLFAGGLLRRDRRSAALLMVAFYGGYKINTSGKYYRHAKIEVGDRTVPVLSHPRL
jgi:hypothetical protein